MPRLLPSRPALVLVLLGMLVGVGCQPTPHDPRKFPDEIAVEVFQVQAQYGAGDAGEVGLALDFSYTVRLDDSAAYGAGLNFYPLVFDAAGDTLFDGQHHPDDPAIQAWHATFADNWVTPTRVRFWVPTSAMRHVPSPGTPLRYQLSATDDAALVTFPPFHTGQVRRGAD
jgi:hypothetical protein